MPAFAYTIVVTEQNKITEVSGVLITSDIDRARQQLIDCGYVVREIRPARQEELTIHALRQLRKRLAGDTSRPTPELPTRRALFTGMPTGLLLWMVVILLLILLIWSRS